MQRGALPRRRSQALADRALTTARAGDAPRRAALREAARTPASSRALGLRNQQLVVNGVFTGAPTATMRSPRRSSARGAQALADDARGARAPAARRRAAAAFDMVGLPALRALLDPATDSRATPRATAADVAADLPPLPRLSTNSPRRTAG